jgi:EAL domain-containing protein (putative c-di-GMP-specific phosphodiesterase class I)
MPFGIGDFKLTHYHTIEAGSVPRRNCTPVRATLAELRRMQLGFEALLRWRHEKLGSIPPNVFIPVAEELKLMCR